MKKTLNRVIVMLVLLSIIATLCSCNSQQYRKGKVKMDIQKQPFGKADGKNVDLYTLTNANGIRMTVMTYGAIVVSLEVPDKTGKLGDVVLGFDTLEEYLKGHPYFGAIVGRYGNRIGKGKFTLDGVDYQLAINNGPNHLHGGLKGFDKVVWDAVPIKGTKAVGIKFSYLSKDGEENYPGNLESTVTYFLTNDDEFKIMYSAKTDKATPINLTHHSYFNLAGQGTRDILDHDLMINADMYTPVDEGLIPTGQLKNVEGTPFDFRAPFAIGGRIAQDDQQLKYGGGYDHNFCLRTGDGAISHAVTVYEPTTGRVMEVHTTEPGVQFYSGNFLDGTNVGKGGKVYKHRYGFCLETQHFPDSPNKRHFPPAILKPGDIYSHITAYKFYAK
ncbi:MAG: aldose epimerase family protein [Planctomycetota bacterium]|jgi:aldose 1-epimerase